MSFGSRTRSVLDGSVLGGDNLGSVGVRQSRRSWGATRRCLDVRLELSPMIGCDLPVLGCAIGALTGAGVISLLSLSLSLSLSACLRTGNGLK